MYLWGREWTRAELEERIGSLSQLGGITRFEYCDGKARGVTALRVKTATGFEFSVIPDRGLDIFEASYQGKSLCWHSSVGITHPAFYDPRNIQWLKTFGGGLLTTCGLTAAGSPSEDQGEELGLHGPISNTPAEHVIWKQEWQADELVLSILGETRETAVFGPNIVNRRSIRTSLASQAVHIQDQIVNEGATATPLMLLYHCNFGFPLLTDRSRIYCKSKKVEGRTEFAKAHIDSWNVFEPPNIAVEERCYYHDIEPDADGNARVLLVDDDSNRSLAIELMYEAANLPRFIEWKTTQPKHFVLGLEPAICKADGRKKERDSGTLRILGPGESYETNITIRVLANKEEITAAVERVAANH
jgi:hypothetical protein